MRVANFVLVLSITTLQAPPAWLPLATDGAGGETRRNGRRGRETTAPAGTAPPGWLWRLVGRLHLAYLRWRHGGKGTRT